MGPELSRLLGLDNGGGLAYLFWSGFGSDLSEITGLLAIAWIFYRHHNCHVRGCWRIGRLPLAGHVVCGRHHPRGVPSHDELLSQVPLKPKE